jgi:hypothetical protein
MSPPQPPQNVPPSQRGPVDREPTQLRMAPPPRTIADAVRSVHDANQEMARQIARLERLAALTEQAPELKTVVINEADNGAYTVEDRNPWAAKSLGILNPGDANVFVGIGGVSARPGSRAPQVPAGGALVLPVESKTIEYGCDPTVLLTNTAVVYVFRYVTVQPLMVIGNL